MKHFIRFALLLALVLPGAANALYYSACDPGAHPSCVPGNDANNGLSAAAPKLTPPSAAVINAAGCGAQHLFARGGRWANYNPGIIDHGLNCQLNQVLIAAYTPPNNLTDRPQLCNTTTNGIVFVMGSYNNTTDDRGYYFRDLDICGDATRASSTSYNSGRGFHFFGRGSYVTLDNVRIRNFRIGIEMSPTIGGGVMTLDHITIKNSDISENYSMGFLGSANDLTITDTRFATNNFSGNDRNHAIYLSPSEYFGRRMTLRRLTLLNNSVAESWSSYYQGAGRCTGGNITAHGNLDGLVLEDIRMEQTGGAVVTCYGFSITTGYPDIAGENFLNVIIRRNRILGFATAIAYENSPRILIENNEIVAHANTTVPNCYIYAGIEQEAGQASAIIRNNSLWVYGGPAICTNQVGSPANQVVANNVVYFWGSTGTRMCANHNAKTAYSIYDRNFCYGATQYSYTYSLGNQTANCPSGAASFDCNGSQANPLFVAPPDAGNDYKLVPASNSPMIGAGSNANCAKLTIDGKTRTGNCTIGARLPN